jgi:hypothetical protein
MRCAGNGVRSVHRVQRHERIALLAKDVGPTFEHAVNAQYASMVSVCSKLATCMRQTRHLIAVANLFTQLSASDRGRYVVL